MCGIIAGISSNIATNLLNGLKQLQNRGYDSAGISLMNVKDIKTEKKASTENLNAVDYLSSLPLSNKSCVGIAHTRWATHGAKNDINSHPHVSMDGKVVIVHNGIIENYKDLSIMLKKYNIVQKSDTDSEVIANLIAWNYSKSQNITDAIEKCIDAMEGTWGLVIMCSDYPNNLYCVRHGSPLLVGYDQYTALITSEQSGFCNYVSNYFELKNHEVCIISKLKEGVAIAHGHNEKKITKIKNTEFNTSPDPYDHWMLKEIFDQPECLERVIKLGSRIKENSIKFGGLDRNIEILKNIDHLILLGCGTSLHSAEYALKFFKDLCIFSSVQCFDGSEFTLNDISKKGNTAAILLSQSGETRDLYRCIEIMKPYDIFTIGVVNVIDSLIARSVDCGCYLHAGREVAVASTKSFFCQCLTLIMVSVWFSQIQNVHELKRIRIVNDIRNLNICIKDTLKCHEKIKELIKEFKDFSSCFLLGKGQCLPIAKEGSLKIKEISYIHAEGYSSSALKHGPFALLRENFPVIVLRPSDNFYKKNTNAIHEVKSRNAKVITIGNNDADIEIPMNQTFSSLLMVIPLQLLSYELSISKGINPDFPRNLAKVVTVE